MEELVLINQRIEQNMLELGCDEPEEDPTVDHNESNIRLVLQEKHLKQWHKLLDGIDHGYGVVAPDQVILAKQSEKKRIENAKIIEKLSIMDNYQSGDEYDTAVHKNLISLETQLKKDWLIYNKYVKQWQTAYPDADLPTQAELLEIVDDGA